MAILKELAAVEEARRSDRAIEIDVWHETLLEVLSDTSNVSKAIESADRVLEAYRERFE